jgi:hypothetical protein
VIHILVRRTPLPIAVNNAGTPAVPDPALVPGTAAVIFILEYHVVRISNGLIFITRHTLLVLQLIER